MFSSASGGSKIALAALAATLRGWGWALIDAQVENPHLLRMGAEHLPRAEFLAHVRQAVRGNGREGPWTRAVGRLPARDLAGG
ncbi:hypothetical protein G6F64_015100 [Rhizopus arrhizus]|uniref:Uncharacterized protein n=2 Tax=cellular organisms TaxID=131567 RepID=A0A9P6WS74_RHIOR|nr:hypothetical protein G6F31_018984 [Rhizopus arrhizus]KAG1274550.1 hypothetical protein G6F64_015100 [Rhizopus arrhizus]